MKVSVITPTGDRPLCLPRLKRYIDRQTVKVDEWVIGDDGNVPSVIGGAMVIRGEHPGDPGTSLVRNCVRAIEASAGDAIVVMEDDDWYAPDHVATALAWLERYPLVGAAAMRIYALNLRAWWNSFMPDNPRRCVLGVTSMQRAFVPAALKLAEGFHKGSASWNRQLWIGQDPAPLTGMPCTCVSLRGLPAAVHGRRHITTKHTNLARRDEWVPDPQWARLREWIGTDAEQYIELCRPTSKP